MGKGNVASIDSKIGLHALECFVYLFFFSEGLATSMDFILASVPHLCLLIQGEWHICSINHLDYALVSLELFSGHHLLHFS